MATCRGVDVSAYQSAQNWAAHKANGVVFAFAKASEGQRSRDPRFATHITGIKSAGLVPGAYHFAWPNQDAAIEAANYIAAVRPYAGRGFTHWLDLERYSDGRNYRGRTASQIRAWVARWMDLVREAFPGQRVGVYTSGSDLAARHVPAGAPLWYPAYPWGEAPYTRAETAPRPSPSGWSPLIWQFTSQPIDRSICYLSVAGLRAWATGTTEEEDMPLTKDDVAAIFKTDGVIGVPPDWSPGNDYWTAASLLIDQGKRLRALQATAAAQGATITKLVDTVAQLAGQMGDLDPAAIVADLSQALESIDIRLDVLDQA